MSLYLAPIHSSPNARLSSQIVLLSCHACSCVHIFNLDFAYERQLVICCLFFLPNCLPPLLIGNVSFIFVFIEESSFRVLEGSPSSSLCFSFPPLLCSLSLSIPRPVTYCRGCTAMWTPALQGCTPTLMSSGRVRCEVP